MPIYNVEQYIERALLSALNQTYQNLEILIVDDLGHDNSMNIVYQLKHTHPRGNCIRIITHKKNLGLGGTRNTAIESAQGKYLYFMDSDDAIVPDCIETLYNIISLKTMVRSFRCFKV
jgi:glycosyltransferase involved in cell wall biosynthesis